MAQQSSEGGLQPVRGRKDPALAQRINQAEAAGEVRPRRRRAAPPPEPEPEPIYEPDAPFEDDGAGLIADDGEAQPDALPALFEGDIVLFRLSKSVSLDAEGHEAWISMGTQSRVQPEEEPQNTVDRLRDFVVGELEYATDVAIAAHQESEAARAAERAAQLRQPRGDGRRRQS